MARLTKPATVLALRSNSRVTRRSLLDDPVSSRDQSGRWNNSVRDDRRPTIVLLPAFAPPPPREYQASGSNSKPILQTKCLFGSTLQLSRRRQNARPPVWMMIFSQSSSPLDYFARFRSMMDGSTR